MTCPWTRHFVTVNGMSIQKSLFHIFDIRKRKPESDTDLRDDTQVKKRKFCPKWLKEFQWLKYDSTEKQMKCKVCLDAYSCQAKPSQSFVHGANNFQRSSLTRHQSGNDRIVAMNIIKQKRSHETVVYHVQEKANTALKAQVRTAFVIGKEEIPDSKFNALIDLQVS